MCLNPWEDHLRRSATGAYPRSVRRSYLSRRWRAVESSDRGDRKDRREDVRGRPLRLRQSAAQPGHGRSFSIRKGGRGAIPSVFLYRDGPECPPYRQIRAALHGEAACAGDREPPDLATRLLRAITRNLPGNLSG